MEYVIETIDSVETGGPEDSGYIAVIGAADGPTAITVGSVFEGVTEETTAEETTEAFTEEVFNVEQTEVTSAVKEEGSSPLGNISVEPDNFVSNLEYMGIGMLGIVAVIAVIIGATVIMNKIFSGNKKQ